MTDIEKESIEQLKSWREYIIKHKESVNKANDIEFYLRTALNLIQKQDTEINKLNNVIEEYKKECRQFKAFCRKIRRDDKHDVDEFNQGQEQKCNQFLNLLAGEKHWTYEGKYFDETDKQIEKMKEDK